MPHSGAAYGLSPSAYLNRPRLTHPLSGYMPTPNAYFYPGVNHPSMQFAFQHGSTKFGSTIGCGGGGGDEHHLHDIDRAARLASTAARACEPTCTWSGQVPAKDIQSGGTFSCKVFVGGVFWNVTEGNLFALSYVRRF